MNKENNQKKDFLWNAVGSLLYALASIVLAFAVIRIVGDDEGGIFGFGFSTLGQQMFIVAYFGIRPFHITDRTPEYSFGDYLGTRRLTSLLAVLGSLLFLGVQLGTGQYSLHKALILLLLALYKIIDGYADVYESELQRQNLLYRSGQSLAFRTTLSVVTLLGSLVLSGSLLQSVLLADLMQIFGTWAFAVRVLRACPKGRLDTRFSWAHAGTLLRSTSLLFFGVFFDFYIFSASKYAIDRQMSNADSGFFNILFMPTSFIYLLANFLIRPMLTRLADQFTAQETEGFRASVRVMVQAVMFLSLGILGATLLLGRWGLGIFELILGASATGRLVPAFPSFLLIILGGALYAMANVMYYILVTVREQRRIFLCYLLTTVLAFVSADRMVAARGMLGGALSYVLLMGVLLVLFSVFVFGTLRKMKNI